MIWLLGPPSWAEMLGAECVTKGSSEKDKNEAN